MDPLLAPMMIYILPEKTLQTPPVPPDSYTNLPEIGEDFVAQLILTEESFHGSGGQYAGGWAAAMSDDNIYSALIIEAEDATIRTIGEPSAVGWNLWSEGTLGEYISIPQTGTYEVVVRAYLFISVRACPACPTCPVKCAKG